MAEYRSRGPLTEYAYVVSVIITVFFMTEKFIYPVIGVLCSILCFLLLSTKGKFRCPSMVVICISYGVIILIQIMIEPSVYLSLGAATRELSRLCIYILVVFIAANTSIREEHFLRLWRFVFCVSLLIAILQLVKMEKVGKMLVDVYGDSREWDLATKYSTLTLFRAGSIFVNANTYAKVILAMFAIFLAIDQKKAGNMTYTLVCLFSIAVSLVLAGSRTGTIIAIFMIVSFYLRGAMSSKRRLKIVQLFILVSLVLGLAVGATMYSSVAARGSGRIRALNVRTGFGDSIAYKLETFRNMVDQFAAANVLIGMGPFETDVWYLTLIDFDIGYLVAFYGTVGCMLYVCMLCDIWNHRRRMPARYSYLNRLLTLILVLFGFSGGLFLNLRVFATFVTMIYVDIVDRGSEPILGFSSESASSI